MLGYFEPSIILRLGYFYPSIIPRLGIILTLFGCMQNSYYSLGPIKYSSFAVRELYNCTCILYMLMCYSVIGSFLLWLIFWIRKKWQIEREYGRKSEENIGNTKI